MILIKKLSALSFYPVVKDDVLLGNPPTYKQFYTKVCLDVVKPKREKPIT